MGRRTKRQKAVAPDAFISKVSMPTPVIDESKSANTTEYQPEEFVPMSLQNTVLASEWVCQVRV